ncbi:MAG: hypothetical protein PHY92_00735 [Alphaproteobacteria bacterium]|nr:hypothetical protein [Alphaproteobacteria bacterium]
MSDNDNTRNETWALAGLLTGRFGPLALSRAAGEAAAAERTGDTELSAMWRNVIACLRQTLGQTQAASPAL